MIPVFAGVTKGRTEGARQGRPYSVKQVAPVINEDTREIVVITLYTLYC